MIIGVIAATAAVIAAAAGVFTPASTEPALTVKESPSAIVVPPTRAPPTEASEAQQPPTDSPSPRAIPDISELDCGLLAGAKTFAGEAGNQGWAEDQDSEDVDDAFLYLNWKYVAVEFDARREVLGPGNEAAVAFEVQDSLWRFVSLADHRDLNTPFMEGPEIAVIPMDDFPFAVGDEILSLHLRFWFNHSFAIDIISIQACTEKYPG